MNDDEATAAAAQGGDRRAAGELLTGFRGRATTIARSLGVQRVDREDAAAEAIARLWTALDKYDAVHDCPFKTYADVVMRHAIINWQGRMAAGPGLTFVSWPEHEGIACDVPDTEHEDADETLHTEETRRALHAAIALLPERTQLIINATLAGDTHETVATRLGLTRQRVDQIIRKVHCELRTLMSAPVARAAA